ncbi:response regulator transcription factor [Rubellimicrobium rubrum]|nr:response regulator transcription factor [Rubellimicrobium rubrum]
MGVVVVSGIRLYREMLAKFLSSASIDVRACCESLDELPGPDVTDVILLHDGEVFGQILQDIRTVRARSPQAPIILVVPADRYEELRAVLWRDVSAIISDDSAADTLVGAVRVVQAGFAVMTPQHRTPSEIIFPPGAAISGRQRGGARSRPLNLSPQESRILSRLVAGGSNKDIANELGICETTVKVHLRACYEKIGAKNRTQAAMWAAAHLDQPS